MNTPTIFQRYRSTSERLLIVKRDIAALKRDHLDQRSHSISKRRADLELEKAELELERARLGWQVEDARDQAKQDKAHSFANNLSDLCNRNGQSAWVSEAHTKAEDWITETGRRPAYVAQL